MIRILLFILLSLPPRSGSPGSPTGPAPSPFEWLGYQVETSAFVGTLALAPWSCCLILLWALLRYLFDASRRHCRLCEGAAAQQGYDALDPRTTRHRRRRPRAAQRYAGIAGRTLPREPLTALLRAQAAQLKGDKAAARRAFEAMLDRPETQLSGLRGLFLEARRSNDNEAARAFAEQAVKRDPQLGWGVNALFDMQARAGDWEGALEHARHRPPATAMSRPTRRCAAAPFCSRRRRRRRKPSQPDKALALASEALRLAPSLVPAAEIAGRILASKGESRQASRLVARTWKLSPHPDLALVYAFAKPGDAPRERVKRVKYLASLTPGDIEGQIAVAIAAIEAHEWQEARNALAPYLEDRPPARICTLMARIEVGELGDKGREREWLARAVRAPRDRAWIADGYVSDRWLPVSPVTGAVDAFEWKAPVDAIGRGDETLLIEEPLMPEALPALASPRDRAERCVEP